MKHLALPLALAMNVLFVIQARADEKVAIEQVPAKVKATIQKHVQNGTLEEIEREQRKDGVVYEVEYTTADGVEYEMDIADDGTLLMKKQDD